MVSEVSGLPKWKRGLCTGILSWLRMTYSRNSKPQGLCITFLMVVLGGLSVLSSRGESVKGKTKLLANGDIIRGTE